MSLGVDIYLIDAFEGLRLPPVTGNRVSLLLARIIPLDPITPMLFRAI